MEDSHYARFSHIDGLKGIAILYVLLFHAYMKNFSAAYLGVDVFFVISGYLLFSKRYFGHNTIGDLRTFFSKKVVRLVAPVTMSVLLTISICPFLALPRELKTTIYTGLYTLLGCSNLYLSSSSHQYFSPETAYCPLMHTWYISVLIQLFILYAIGCTVADKVSIHKKTYILFILFIVSLFCSSHGIITDHYNIFGESFSLPFDYYSTTSRIWEVLAGGGIALMKKRADNAVESNAHTHVSLLALFLIISIPIFCGGRGKNILPIIIVASTMICIAYGNRALCGSILNWKPLRKLGEISFSLYLIHMPVLAFYRAAPTGNICTDLMVAISILVLAVFFHFLIEKRKFRLKTIAGAWGASLCFMACLLPTMPNGLFLWKTYYAHYTPYEGWTKCDDQSYFRGLDTSQFTPFDGAAAMSRSGNTEADIAQMPIIRESLLMLGKQKQPTYLLVGDSFAAMLYYGFNDWGKGQDVSGLYLQSYVVPFYGWQFNKAKGSEQCEALISWLKQHPEIRSVIISQNWVIRTRQDRLFIHEKGFKLSEEEALGVFLQKIKETGCKVAIIAQLPTLYAATKKAESMQMTAFDQQNCSRQEYEKWSSGANEMLERLASKGLCSILHWEDAYFYNGMMTTCRDGEYIMFDGGHLSPLGSQKLIQAHGNQLLQWLTAECCPDN